MNSNEANDLDTKKPLLPDKFLFPVEAITGNLEDYGILQNCLKKSTENTQLSSIDRSNLRFELMRMKTELLAKQKLYQAQFDELKNWMKESFQVSSPQVLLDHQAVLREEELAAEDAANQGNSKQHQRIRSLTRYYNTILFNFINLLFSNQNTEKTKESPVVARASKNLSRMNNAGATASAPTTTTGGGQGQKDLSSLKSKVSNQIPINVFWNYVEPFFKPIDEDDLKYLDDPSHVMDVAPFVIPPLGLHYEKIWYEQYGYVVPGGPESSKRSSRLLSEQNGNSKQMIQLRDRLLSALIDKEANIPDAFSEEDDCFGDEIGLDANEINHMPSSVPLDDRLRNSLGELGFTDLTSSRDYQENDEICVEMRSIQRQLREQIVINQYRKKRLAEFIRTKLASQEFYSLIGDLDKQVDGIFQKRIKNAKKKKSVASSKTTIDQSASTGNEIAPEALQCLENRRKLLDAFAEIVPSRVDSLCPENQVGFDESVEKGILETAKRTSKWLPLPEIILKQPLTSSQPAFPNSR